MTDLADPQPSLSSPAPPSWLAPDEGSDGFGDPDVLDPERYLTPVDYWLAQQQSLTAVERFAQHHETAADAGPEARYRDLVPLTLPKAGEQYAFEVDLDTCTGCKACVAACHSLNGLDDDEAFRSVGTLYGGPTADPVVQTVTSACHHCLDPACLDGCPTLAYEKDLVTGIVKHLDDQCIGCQYCTLTCPYEVPSYNSRLGIVRKCDMCSDRLADGEAPACVQACPTESIAVRIVDVSSMAEQMVVGVVGRRKEQRANGASLVPSAPVSSLTRPTTTYRSATVLPADLEPADHHSAEPAHAHTPLAVTLVLTQVAVGLFVMGLFQPDLHSVPALAFFTGLLALGASLFHLGRPHIAWKAVLGLRRSWVSREIVAFSAFAITTAAYSVGRWLGVPAAVVDGLGVLGAIIGIAGVGTSVMIYAATRKRWWAGPRTAVTFGLTTVLAGLAGTIAVQAVTSMVSSKLAWALFGLTAVKLGWDALPLRRARHAVRDEIDRSAALLLGPLRLLTARRFALGGAALALDLIMAASGRATPLLIALLAVAAVLVGELVERRLFFLAVSSPRMPGELR